jgi:quercetin dioxygenase-like cupin family protein
MYPYPLPHTISNFAGEELTFKAIELEDGVQKMLIDNRIQPGSGPPMHVHFQQEEYLRVVKGTIGYQVLGKEAKYAGAGESILFERNVVHRFWNAGDDILECTGWVKPANTTDYFLTAQYNSMNKAGKMEGDLFDGAYLLTRYRSEYDVMIIPPFVKRVIMPVVVVIGKLLGKYGHFKDAPEPLK